MCVQCARRSGDETGTGLNKRLGAQERSSSGGRVAAAAWNTTSHAKCLLTSYALVKNALGATGEMNQGGGLTRGRRSVALQASLRQDQIC
jgi:hypothetical protein